MGLPRGDWRAPNFGLQPTRYCRAAKPTRQASMRYLLVGTVSLCLVSTGCDSTKTERPKPTTIAVNHDALVVARTTTTKTTWYRIGGAIPLIPQTRATTTYDVRYRSKRGLFGKQDLHIQTTLVESRPPGTPPISHDFIEFLESPPQHAIDLYVPAGSLTRAQYLALANSIKANLATVREALGRPVASIRHATWQWDS